MTLNIFLFWFFNAILIFGVTIIGIAEFKVASLSLEVKDKISSNLDEAIDSQKKAIEHHQTALFGFLLCIVSYGGIRFII